MADLSNLNQQQREAVEQSMNHNVVLLAGAGSGKTSVLVKRTQYLIEDVGVSPSEIMMITFTNKAANEIRERVAQVTSDAYKMWIGTFHHMCTKILRMFGEKIGVKSFSIMDTKDSKELIKKITKDMMLEYTTYQINGIASKISEFKNNMQRPVSVLTDEKSDKTVAAIYQEYQNRSWRQRSFDFDDLIIYTILLLSKEEVADWVHSNIKYVMVDESQDTNVAQFMLAKLFAGNNNVMLVGDVNQSIYAFRNAKPQYLENFANTHPNTVKMRLEQNYRSTKTIIEAANRVIGYNKFGTKLHMFCSNETGENIQTRECMNSFEEGKWIASEILVSQKPLSDFAVIYRTNSQSRAIEEAFTAAGIGYVVFGSQSFYSRKEVRDLLSYLKLYCNPNDMNALKRILGTLKGVGKVTVNAIIDYALKNQLDMVQGLSCYITAHKISPAVQQRLSAVQRIFSIKNCSCSEVISNVLIYTEYKTDLMAIQSDETMEKLEIIDEFQSMLLSMEKKDPGQPMADIIDQIALLSDVKGEQKASANAVKLMTAHSSKGLEFDTVFIAGCEEGIFPHANALNENTFEAIEEERRLFYVAMTRAKKKLYITRAHQRQSSKDGGLIISHQSRFLNEIPRNLTEDVF